MYIYYIMIKHIKLLSHINHKILYIKFDKFYIQNFIYKNGYKKTNIKSKRIKI